MQRVWSTYLDSNGYRQQRSSSPGPHLMDNSPHSSRRASIVSHANSSYSQAGSTRHILGDMNNGTGEFGGPLDPPVAPFTGVSRDASPLRTIKNEASSVSLSVNYLPSKFSATLLSPAGPRRRRGAKEPLMPKQGGGVEAFRSGEARMPGQYDDDYDGVTFTGKGKKLRWNRFKWILFFANLLLTTYSTAALIVCLLTWFNVWTHADIVRVGNRPELIISTIASCLGIFTSLIGWSGILLNNRGFLATYTFLLWVVFAFLVTPGYMSYRRRAFNLEGKINAQWSREIGSEGRLRIQNELQCCGYFSPFVEATVSQTCYARSVLPGCKLGYLQFQRMVLGRWFKVAFIIVPFHLGIMLSGLLCSNHITYRFGKGMMPEAYRLNMNSMAVIMDNYANQLAEQYGSDVASEIVKRSRSNLQLDTMPTMPYSAGQHAAQSPYSRSPETVAT